MLPILFGSVILSVAAFAFMRKGDTPTKPDDDDHDEDDDIHEGEDDSDLEPDEQARDPNDSTDDEGYGPDDYDDADVYYSVDEAKKRARKARVPKVKS